MIASYFPVSGKRASSQRNLERPGHAHQRDVFLLRAGAQQPVVSAQKQPLGDERIETRNNDGKPLAGSAQAAFNRGETASLGDARFLFFCLSSP
jgi:phosphopantetheinyl transferase